MNGKEKKLLNISQILLVKDVTVDRLKEEALCVKIDNHNISEVTKKSILDSAKEWFKNLEKNLDQKTIKNSRTYIKRN